MNGCRPDLSDKELCRRFWTLDNEINVIHFLSNLPIAERESRGKNNIVLQLTPTGDLTVHKFNTIEKATEGYFDLENENPEDDIVLVRAKSFDAIRSAYRNYFQNTSEFIRYILDGTEKLDPSDKPLEVQTIT